MPALSSRTATPALLVLTTLTGCHTEEPASVPPPLDLGIESVRTGELEADIHALRTALASGAGDAQAHAEAHRWIGHTPTRNGDREGALEEYGAALALVPDDPWLRYARGVAWSTTGELEQAIGSFTRALELDPGHVKSLQWRGTTRLDRGEARLAVEDFTRALECLETADEAALARWGERREALEGETLRLWALALDALGDSEAAARDRARRTEILGGSG